ncbi:MAG: CRISPR-associated protein Cas5 [Bacillota bacterium]|jgi:CRISPR-associated protein Cas5h
MKVLSFYLRGKMAHFRKFYSNSSALSYFIPPRTTIVGIVAGLLGYKRDTYYEDFSLDKCKIAIASCKPIKKNMQKMNYLMIKTLNDLNGSQEYHSQTPIELVIPQDIRTGYVDYKIWMHHRDEKIMDALGGLLNYNSALYTSLGACISLGSAFNLGWIQYDGISEVQEICNDSEQMISSVIPVDNIKELKIIKINTNSGYKIIKEELPLEFDANRCITSRGLKEVIANIEGNSIPAVVNTFTKLDNKENIVWME